MFMQAGFALLETGFVPGQERRPHHGHEHRRVRHRGRRLLPLRLRLHVRRLLVNVPGADWGYSHAIGGALVGTGQWVFLWKGGWALTGGKFVASGRGPRLLPVHARLHGHGRHHPHRGHGRTMEVQVLRACGASSAARSTTRSSAPGPGAAVGCRQLGNSWKLGQGYVDFAGSGVVHAVGGVAALTGAFVLGPRIGKYDKDGRSRGLPGHSIALAGAGTLILMFGWFGFNAGSTLQITDAQFGLVAANTAIAAAFGCIGGMFWVWRRTGKPDPGHDHERPARRAGRHHRRVRLRRPVGGGRHRRSWRGCSWSRPCSSSITS